MTKRAHWYRTSPKSWQMREVETDGTENGAGYVDDTGTGFAWSTSQWIPDNKGTSNERTEFGKETTYRQARDRILGVFRIQPKNIDYFVAAGSRNPKRVTASEVEPARKPSKPTTIKRTSKAARARQPKKSGKGAWAKIRAFVMPGKKKKAKSRR